MSVESAKKAVIDALEELDREKAAEADREPGLVIDWLLITATRRFDEDGDACTAIGWDTPPTSSFHQALGLMSYVTNRMHVHVNAWEDADE